MLNVSGQTLWRWDRIGRSLMRMQLGPNAVGWHDEEIHNWLMTRRPLVPYRHL